MLLGRAFFFPLFFFFFSVIKKDGEGEIWIPGRPEWLLLPKHVIRSWGVCSENQNQNCTCIEEDTQFTKGIV